MTKVRDTGKRASSRSSLLTARALRDRIDRLPRARLAVLPTGLQELPRLAATAGVDQFYVKRDDLTGVALGGSKSRLMEFVLGDAIQRGCDVLVAGGGAEQSNHAAQCVASASKAGLDAVMVLRRRPDARPNGNALLHEVPGGRTEWVESDPRLRDRGSAAASMREVAGRLRAGGRRPYVLESSLHPLSVIAYLDAALELRDQLAARSGRGARIYVTSEGAALGGLLLGARALGEPWQVTGLDWRPRQAGTKARLLSVIREAAALLEFDARLTEESIDLRDAGGPAYGVGRPASWAALRTAARLEGLILDPVYTAKGMAGALTDLRERSPAAGERAVFVHTGGVAALFAYEAELRRHVIAVRDQA